MDIVSGIKDMWKWDKPLAVFLTSLSIVVTSLMVCFLYWAADSWFLASKIEEAVLVDRYSGMQNLKNSIIELPIEKYFLVLDVEGNRGEINVDKYFYNTTKLGNSYLIKYKKERISNTILINSIITK